MNIICIKNNFDKNENIKFESTSIPAQISDYIYVNLKALSKTNNCINVYDIAKCFNDKKEYILYKKHSIDLSEYDIIFSVIINTDRINVRGYYYDEDAGIEEDVYKYSVIFKKNQNGNCIDDFLERGVKHIIDSINEYIKDIESRQEQRINVPEYHQTACYEQDFNRICMIRLLADKISNNCSTHLERISEKYTELS